MEIKAGIKRAVGLVKAGHAKKKEASIMCLVVPFFKKMNK